MTQTIDIEPDPLSIKRLLGLLLLSVAIVLAISQLTNIRIETKTPQLAVNLRPLESKVEASSIQEVIPSLVPEKPSVGSDKKQEQVEPVRVVTGCPNGDSIPLDSPKCGLVPEKPPEPKPAPAPKPKPVPTSHQGMMAEAGISPSDYASVEFIVMKESTWRHLVTNKEGAHGLCQALPGKKMSTAGVDWHDNPITQLRWCNQYAHSRYGSWGKAVAYWKTHRNW